jgi:hypothetical protein
LEELVAYMFRIEVNQVLLRGGLYRTGRGKDVVEEWKEWTIKV